MNLLESIDNEEAHVPLTIKRSAETLKKFQFGRYSTQKRIFILVYSQCKFSAFLSVQNAITISFLRRRYSHTLYSVSG